MELKDIIYDYKIKNNVTNDFIAQKCNVDKSTVSRWLSGDVKRIQEETKNKLNELLKIDITPLLKGTVISIKKPILGTAKAGYNFFAQENYLGEEEVTLEDSRKGDYFIQVVGNSMDGARIHDGDLAYIHQCENVASGDIALVLIGEDEITIKRILYKEKLMILEAANPNVENRYFTKKEVEDLPIKILGKVLYCKTYF